MCVCVCVCVFFLFFFFFKLCVFWLGLIVGWVGFAGYSLVFSVRVTQRHHRDISDLGSAIADFIPRSRTSPRK